MSFVMVETEGLSGWEDCFFVFGTRSGKSSEFVSIVMELRWSLDVALRGPRLRLTDCVGSRLPMRTAR